MGEKRFEIRRNINGEHWLFDNRYDRAIMISKIRATLLDVCNLLNGQQSIISDLKEENEKLRKQCFELERDYVIETSDVSDKIYLDDEIRELKQRYGVDV